MSYSLKHNQWKEFVTQVVKNSYRTLTLFLITKRGATHVYLSQSLLFQKKKKYDGQD